MQTYQKRIFCKKNRCTIQFAAKSANSTLTFKTLQIARQQRNNTTINQGEAFFFQYEFEIPFPCPVFIIFTEFCLQIIIH